MTTVKYIRGVKNKNRQPFDGKQAGADRSVLSQTKIPKNIQEKYLSASLIDKHATKRFAFTDTPDTLGQHGCDAELANTITGECLGS